MNNTLTVVLVLQMMPHFGCLDMQGCAVLSYVSYFEELWVASSFKYLLFSPKLGLGAFSLR